MVINSKGDMVRAQKRSAARAIAERQLAQDGKEVEVLRVSRSVKLTLKDLISSLPGDSF